MATRRLKLFVVAYLQGLLKPDYRNGISSRIRENLVLEALNDELDAESINNTLLVDISSTNIVPREDLSGLYDSIYDKIYRIRSLKEFEKESAPLKKNKKVEKVATDKKVRYNSAEDLVKLYNVLLDTGMLEKIASNKKR